MSTYHLALLGTPLLTGPGGPIRIGVRKAQALLLYLAVQRGSRFSRSHLAGLLWENSPEPEALRNLRLALHRLRQALPVWPVATGRDSLAWDAEAGVQLDTETLLELLRQENATALAAAVALRRGALLSEFDVPDSTGFTGWLQAERQLWDERVLLALERLILLAGDARAWQQAAAYARQALAIDPLEERFHRHLMHSRYQAGERGAALAAFADCQAILQTDLGVAPDPATSSLYADLRAERIPLLPAPAAVPSAAAFPPPDPWQKAPEALPLVGREAELAAAQDVIRDSHLGKRRVLLISAEAGIGKTRLLTELMNGGAPGTFLVAHCHEGTSALPLAPITLALRQALPKADVNQLPTLWLQEVARLLPELAEGRPELRREARRTPEQNRDRLLEGVARFLKTLPEPFNLCIEDLHWADEATLQFVGYLARRMAAGGRGPARALIITCRPGEESAGTRDLLGELEREDRLRRIDLAPLTAGAIGELVRAGTGAENPLLAARLFAQSQGHPFYAVELLRTLQADAPDGGEAPMPRTIQAVIRRRLERLSPLAAELVTAAAIFPRSARFDLLVQMTGAPVDEAIVALESALAAGILTEMNGRAASVGLQHELIRRVVADDLSAPRRRSLHQQAFAQLLRHSGPAPDLVGERGGPPLELAEELAAHARGGELWEPAAQWYQAAGGAAERVFAYPEAARFLEQGLDCLNRLPSTPARAQAAIDIRLRLSNLSDLGLPRRAQQWLAPVAEEAHALGDAEREAAALQAQGQLLITEGKLPEAVALLRDLIPVARRLQSPTLLAQALSLLGTAHIFLGEYQAARACLSEAMPLYGEGSISDFLYRQARSSLIWVLAIVGEFEGAMAQGSALLAECRQWGDPAGVSQATTAVANASQAWGRWDEALRYGHEGMEAAQATDYRFYGYINAMHVGLAQVRLGDTAGGIRALEEIVALAESEGIGALLDVVFLFLGDAYLAAQQFEPAEAALRRGRQLAATSGVHFMVHRMDRVLGQVHAATGRIAEARALIQGAEAGLRDLGARPEQARCHACLAALAPTEAERSAHRRQAEQMFRTMHMAWDLAQLAAGPRSLG